MRWSRAKLTQEVPSWIEWLISGTIHTPGRSNQKPQEQTCVKQKGVWGVKGHWLVTVSHLFCKETRVSQGHLNTNSNRPDIQECVVMKNSFQKQKEKKRLFNMRLPNLQLCTRESCGSMCLGPICSFNYSPQCFVLGLTWRQVCLTHRWLLYGLSLLHHITVQIANTQIQTDTHWFCPLCVQSLTGHSLQGTQK